MCLQILSKKYIRCSARMMVAQLVKLLRMKLNIPEEKQVSIDKDFHCWEKCYDMFTRRLVG